MKCTPREQDALRFRALRALWIGETAASVSAIFQVTEKTLYTWVRNFNTFGIEGLLEDKRPGRPRIIPECIAQPLCGVLREPERADVLHWTAKKFHGYLTEKLRINVSYATTVRFLHEQKFSLQRPRPWSNRQDPAARAAFVQQVDTWLTDIEVDLWFADESGFEGDPRPRTRWAQVGSAPRRVKNGDHLRLNALGMVAPRTGEFFAIEATGCDVDVFQAFIDEAQKFINLERTTNILILDNASWHKVKTIDWGRFTPVYLPPYSPDLNPIERLWLVLKSEYFADFFAKDQRALESKLDEGLNWLASRKSDNQRTCAL
jgi:transposase